MALTLKLHDRLPAPTSRTMKDSGELVAPCTFARSGVMKYLAKELSPLFDDLPPNQVVRVMRTADELYKPSVMEALKSAPITIGHPNDDVSVDNYKELAKGVLSGMPTKGEDSTGESTLAGEVCLNDKEAIRLSDEGKAGLSLGYRADLIRVQGNTDYDAMQINIRPNHIAIVGGPRAGWEFRIGDSAELLELEEALAEEAKLAEELVNKTTELTVKLADAEAKISELEAKLDVANESLASKSGLRFSDADIVGMVESRVGFLLTAKRLTDEDLTKLSEGEAMRKIVTARIGDMSQKSDSYVQARYEILLEDEAPSELQHIMQAQLKTKFADKQAEKTPSEISREKMILRNAHKE